MNASFTTIFPNMSSATSIDNSLTNPSTPITSSTAFSPPITYYDIPTTDIDVLNDTNTYNVSWNVDGNLPIMNFTNVTLPPVVNGTNVSSQLNDTMAPPTSPGHFWLHACRHMSVIGRLVHVASPFLFPCTIEYSLICAAVIYRMWVNLQISKYTCICGKRKHYFYMFPMA